MRERSAGAVMRRALSSASVPWLSSLRGQFRRPLVHAHGVKGGRANAKAVLHNYAPTVDAVPLASSGDVGTCTGTDNPPEK